MRRNELNTVRIYNMLFPMWLFFLFPSPIWLLILPGNFLIDSAVIWFTLRASHKDSIKYIWKKSILRVWLVGFFCDIIGALLILGIYLLTGELFPQWDIFHFPGTTIISIPGVILAGVLIYFINRKVSFVYTDLSEGQKKYLAFSIALYTAPYLMLVPLYG